MQKSYALFDFDGTLIPGDSIVRFMLYAKKRGLCGVGALLRGALASALYYAHLTTAERAKSAGMRFVAGREQAEMASLAEDFCRDIITPMLYPQGLSEISKRRAEGADVLLITASPAFYLEPLKQMLGITDIIGTRMDVVDGRFTGLICGENCRGIQKPLRLAEYLAARGDRLSFDTSYAYGDSASDEPMLALCQNKVAVNPKPKLLRALQATPGVEIVRWGAEPSHT